MECISALSVMSVTGFFQPFFLPGGAKNNISLYFAEQVTEIIRLIRNQPYLGHLLSNYPAIQYKGSLKLINIQIKVGLEQVEYNASDFPLEIKCLKNHYL
jgi:hypothetical protein